LARYHQSVCRLCRREGEKLFLKGDRCFKEKCALEKRNVPPGQHGKRRGRVIGYGAQLREKQKVKRIYGILERQFRNYFKKASLKKGITGEILLTLLERRLDNVVYRLGFSTSRPQARQLVSHGAVLVNGKKVDVPNYQVKPADLITITPKAAKNTFVEQALSSAKGRGIPEWLELDSDNLKGKVLREPKRSDILYPINEQLIVELYSK